MLAEEVNGFVDALIMYTEKNENDERPINRAKESINAKATALQLKINEDLNSFSSKDKKMGTDPYSMALDKSVSSRPGMLLNVIEITNVAIDGFFKLIKYFDDKAAHDDFIQKLELRKWEKISP